MSFFIKASNFILKKWLGVSNFHVMHCDTIEQPNLLFSFIDNPQLLVLENFIIPALSFALGMAVFAGSTKAARIINEQFGAGIKYELVRRGQFNPGTVITEWESFKSAAVLAKKPTPDWYWYICLIISPLPFCLLFLIFSFVLFGLFGLIFPADSESAIVNALAIALGLIILIGSVGLTVLIFWKLAPRGIDRTPEFRRRLRAMGVPDNILNKHYVDRPRTVKELLNKFKKRVNIGK